jgi:RES domain-containing protein
VTITAYRITKTKFAAGIWSGIGARNFGGRWNSKGGAVVYAAENRSLAALEQLVHVIKPRVLRGFVIGTISFDESCLTRVREKTLPRNWDRPIPPAALRRIGDRWLAAGRFAVLAVPSAVVRGEWNYLINPNHRDFRRMTKSAPEAFVYDHRLA